MMNLNFVVEKDFIKKSLLLKSFLNDIEKFKILVLGNGATFMGLDLNLFKLPAVNFSADFQDLYFNIRQSKQFVLMHRLLPVDISPKIKTEGFKVVKKRWGVERTFAWFDNSRRLDKDL